jgi:hypothetical protein
VPARGTVVVLDGHRVALQWLARTALLLLWSLVVWGVLLLLATLSHAVSDGPRPALARLLPAGGTSIWAWVNVLSMALALGVGLVTVGLLAWGRRGKTEG